jgi:Tfp pilus assembly protein PilF
MADKDSGEVPNPLKNIVYISIPEDMRRTIGEFEIDPSILLPVEIPPGEEELQLHNLSWEMIAAAMLKILAYQPDHENIDYYRRFILTIKPNIPEELAQTAIIKAKNKDYDLAEEIFSALSNLLPDKPNNTLNLALVYEQHAEAYENLGNEELREVYMNRAFDAYKKTLDRDPQLPDAYYNIGFFYLRNHNREKAKHHFEQYLQLGKDKKRIGEVKDILEKLDQQEQLDTLFKEAYDYIRLGKEEKGIDRINKFLEMRPDVSNAWFLLGWAFRRTGKYQEGKNAFLKALELGSEETDTLNELAICLMELGEYQESRKRLSEALQMEPENVKIISNLGILSLKEEKTDEAVKFFKTVLEIDPDDPIAQRYLSYLEES